jgi:cyclopropane fatty-acyl-phospholipid synthase-like methyltransferase
VGDQLISQGFLVRALPIKPPATLLEFGPGWGNSTLHFLGMGYQVTAVEVNPRFCELLRRRFSAYGAALEVVEDDMLRFQSREQFDLVVFFESFHHCQDHLTLLRNVRQMLKPSGALVFAAEPVADFPYPWGVRLDGESLWAMRRYGWLELGFDRKYFFKTLKDEGFRLERLHNAALGHLSEVIIAHKQR